MGNPKMPKKPQKAVKRPPNSTSVKQKSKNAKIGKDSQLEAVVGGENVKRWFALKSAFSSETNQIFVTKLLDLAQQHLDRSASCKPPGPLEDLNNDKGNGKKPNQIKTKKKKAEIEDFNRVEKNTTRVKIVNVCKANEDPNGYKNLKVEIPLTSDIPQFKKFNSNVPREIPPEIEIITNEGSKKKAIIKDTPKKSTEFKKKIDFDIRKAPELNNQTEVKVESQKPPEDIIPTTQVTVNKSKMCSSCNMRHAALTCPVVNPNYIILDSINISDWREKYQEIHKNEIEKEYDGKNEEINDKYVYAKLSLPSHLQLIETNTEHGLGVSAKDNINEFTQFGPLTGVRVKEVDISEDSSMKDVWEIILETGNIYFNTSDSEESNWLRFIRPAPIREEKNVTVVVKEDSLFFVTVKPISNGEELLYWQESSLVTHKKKLEKTSCGGCNMTFAHPLYYRTHCSVFHDLRYSLTIRKYHCKVCGAAVLGKENIMKHAAELHNGQGAYQCQFCKKFFLRLNYLEMHRTYGCSANPHRSRPLCDFCGRKFCQPQKLKVHIKRMHSDISEVLKEFQCKNCLKILGSRAALQRHLKEVHQKQLDGACSCSRCGKHFQNKSNLKIHMLTHSGIKPFKCTVKNCNAAFTTKQCLQFHYKKVHNFNEEIMPKIARSIDYTFEAYSGVDDQDEISKIKDDNAILHHDDSTAATFDEESDIDDASMDSKNPDDPPALQSPEKSPESPIPIEAPPIVDSYPMKILSKGSKKWIADQPELYQMADHRLAASPAIQQEVQYERPKLSNLTDFGRHEASNASLLVEAALDSVCSEPNIDIDVSSNNCADSLVNNLYTLAPPDGLTDVTYGDDQRDINLISPSVNDHISVTDELNDELRHNNQSIGMDYSGFHQEDFSPANSPDMHHRNNFVRNYISTLSPQNNNTQQGYQPKSASPCNVPSPPRYDFGHATADHLSSDENSCNGIGAQNLSLHSKHDMQLDLSMYKSPYKIEGFQRRLKFDHTSDLDKLNKTNNYQSVNLESTSKSYLDVEEDENNGHMIENMNQNDINDGTIIQVVDNLKDKEDDRRYPDDLSTDLRNKFDLDLDMRIKTYEVEAENLRTRGIYESAELDFRNKTYDLVDPAETRKLSYESLDSDFRTDRNSFEPLVLNAELQGLDMSARSFHNYPNLNRYHHLYPDVDSRVDLRLNYSPPPPSYTHADILRVVSLDLTPPGRHSVDLSLRTHPATLHQIANSHRLLDQTRLDLTSRHLPPGLGEPSAGGRILSDHTTNRILANNVEQLGANHLLSEDARIIGEQSRLLDGRILPPTTPNGGGSPVPFGGYTVSQSPYHPTPLAPRPHVSSPTPTPYHHYSTYY